MGKLYGIGVGPGDKELITVKAVNIIKKVDVIVVPTAVAGGDSMAYNIAKDYIEENTRVIFKQFPMGGKDQEKKIYEAYEEIAALIKEDNDVAFLTIGDPFVFSTYTYLLEHIKGKGIEVITVPGITSFCASASAVGKPLVIGDEPLLILPATRLDSVKDEKFLVIMKFYKVEKEVIEFLEERGFQYTCVRRVGSEQQQILTSKEEIINNRDYMSLIIARRK
ncbi:precorrin-2/cobalt-factor-2 C20-methyltransferase [Hathewaya proteolytica DSM 3090]|uniref:Precorrin-2/cobalt-factor-2 C20-methyltransferase n=1 Tax=Hathewaya proteolytica DSM 3090 TaxID=1121331 RepID=A0A1M6Q4J8_9CLOT|nr:cobalt-factor II C(20)-methyltransferase [Hathewaya proteolytica]SHK15071.1 precorrin-2/cobalt-factor-2 C20-methyltransferase [Hathewaya proteolytica DSM 3090]